MANTSVSKLYDHYDYIHYSAENADFSAIKAMNKLGETKSNIIQRYGKFVLARRENAYISRLDPSIRKEVDAWLSGTAFSGMSKSEVAVKSQPFDLADYYSLEEAIARAGKDVSSILDDIGNFCNQVEKNIMEYLSSQGLESMRQKYDAYLMKNFLNGDFSAAQGTYADQLLAALLSRSNDKLFHSIPKVQNSKKDEGQVLATSVAKMIALARALPEANLSSAAVKYSDGSSTYAKTESEVLREIIKKYQGWVNQLNQVAAEQGVCIAVMDGNKEMLEKLDDFKVEHTGTKSLQVEWTPDPQIKKLLSQTKNGLKRATGYKTSKADGAIQYIASDGSVLASMGLSVKEVKTKKGTSIEGMKTADIRLQHSTPLLTLLTREGGLSGTDMNEIYNLVSVHGDSGNLNDIWNDLIEYLKYRTLLNALMGINTQEQSYFMVLNGKFIKMSDLLNHIMDGNGTVSWGQKMADSSVSGSGLTRTPYVRRNWWQPPKSKNPYRALKRSAKQQQTVSSIMYATKITVNLRLTELATLMKFAR